MNKKLAAALFLFLGLCGFARTTAGQSSQVPPKDAPILKYALANAREEGTKAEWKGADNYLAATKYIEVTLGTKDYVFTRNGKYVKARHARYRSAGVMGNYAEVGWDYLDKHMKTFSDTYGHYLMHHAGGKWQKVARNAGDGYDKDNDLHKAGVPDSIIKRLKFN